MDVTDQTPPVGGSMDYNIPGENWIHGIRHMALVTADTRKRLPDFPVHEDDVYICAYPKSGPKEGQNYCFRISAETDGSALALQGWGNTWVTTIVSAILSQDNLDAWIQQPPIVPGTHMDLLLEHALKLPHPSYFYCHLPYYLLPSGVLEKNVKIVHVSRDPKDVAVSYYYLHRNLRVLGPWDGPWEVFYDNFISGQVPWGSYFSFVRSYWEQKNNPNVMNIRYEQLKRDPKTWIGKLAEFLGKRLNPETLDKIIELTSFGNMKKTPSLNIETFLRSETEFGPPLLTPGGSFLRKGEVGDWRHLFTEEQRRQTDGLYRQLCKDMGVDASLEADKC